MPVYEYRCRQCRHQFEQVQPVGQPAPVCPRCGGETRKVYSSVGLIFKGSGFHTTDYRKPARANGDGATPPAGASTKKEDTAAPASAPPSPPASAPPSR
ncbi:MAG: zinc ribbon domain-containing protein [Armatimonadota bacterium]|nr:zinc ribbon domain-containing protein [Armatimonadota bacterium]MDR7532899.1 zinc ribbon domain-containing protein [Armatimonadota bacterium]MDR7536106.1 zinc ribbon domain-containing protein [Armatimonadota bacterium]